MTNVNNACSQVYSVLSFQFKPLEDLLKKTNPTMYKEYLTYEASKKIRFMDILARKLGL